MSLPSVTTETRPQLRRELGQWDLIWLSVVAITNLNLVPVFASYGSISLWLLLLALGLFFWPQGVTVIELSHRYPGEGGIYLWTKEFFGDFHGFLCGWCYWTVNFFYIPTLLFYLVGISLFIGSSQAGSSAENRLLFFFFTLGLLWLIAILNIRGLGVGKWVNNLGGIGTFVAASAFIVLGLLSLLRHGSQAPPPETLRRAGVDWRLISSFGVICFGLIGLELGSVMGDEIREPHRTIPRGVFWGGMIAGTLYLGATLSLLLAVPRREIVLVQGGMQAISRMTGDTGLTWLASPVALLMILSIAGASSAWLAGAARIMFVAGLDRYLPSALGRIHAQHATPYVALIVQAMVISLVVGMGFIGASVREAYLTLLDLAVVLNLICYFYMYAVLLRVTVRRAGSTYYRNGTLRIAALSGLVTTSIGMTVAFIPARQISSIWLFELKMFAGLAVFLGLAVFFFRFYSRRLNR